MCRKPVFLPNGKNTRSAILSILSLFGKCDYIMEDENNQEDLLKFFHKTGIVLRKA